MRVFRNRKLNNKGVSLVTVIVCMLFAAIIAAGVLTISVSNVEFTNQQKRNAQSNYTAEQVMDETKASIKTIADEAYSKAFEDTMKTYGLVCDGATTIEMVFKKEFNTEFIKLLLDNYVISKPNGSEYTSLSTNQEVAEKVMEELASTTVLTKLSNPSMLVEESELNEGKLVKSKKHPNVYLTLRPEPDGTNTLILKDLAFEYEDKYSNTSEAMTDLIMNVSFPTIRTQGAGAGQATGPVSTNANFLDWTMIADSSIQMDGTASSGTREINGNIYSGGDIRVWNVVGGARTPGFIFDNGRIVARGNLQLSDSSVSKITNSEIWVSKILQKNEKVYNASRTDTFINGKLYIADNIEVSSSGNSTFIMIDDNNELYFYNNGTNPAFKVSSGQRVIINGASSIDGFFSGGFSALSAKGIDQLWIADRGTANALNQDINLARLNGNATISWYGYSCDLYVKPDSIKNKTGGKLYSEKDTSVTSNVTAEDANAKFGEIRDKYIGLSNGLDPDCTTLVDKVTTVFGDIDVMKNGRNAIAAKIKEVSGNNSFSFSGKIDEGWLEDDSRSINGLAGNYYISNASVTLSHTGAINKEASILAGGDVTIEMGSFKGIVIAAGDVTIDADFTGVIYAGKDVKIKHGNTVNASIIASGNIKLEGNVTVNALNNLQKEEFRSKIEGSPIFPMIFIPTTGSGEEPEITPTEPPVSPSPEPTSAPVLQNSYDSISIEYDNWRKY